MQKPTERLKRKIEKENLWLFILSSLEKKDRHGKELRNIIMKRFDFLTGTMTAYKVLYLLETGGYVESKKSGKYILYKITNKGKDELKKAKGILKNYIKRI